ncbi:interleukin-8-like [Rhineura floridana]|uniref:interleukin-8-like n=1 Tax=Rhineura floridana TaxID=261503 RepID=UPI002AC884FC|nr:interleukin-8-like [Rhineura floridana]
MKRLIVVLLTLVLLASNIAPLCGVAMETHVVHVGRCKCQKHTSSVFGPQQLKSIQVIPRGIHCRNTEIILTLKNNWKVCSHPNAEWVQKLIKKLTKANRSQ